MEKWEVYVGEAIHQLEFAEACFATFQGALASHDNELVFSSVHHFLVHVANVDKLLDPKPGSKRAAILGGRIDVSDFKSFRRLRNHLEHFDERLHRWIENHDGKAFFDMNIVTGTRGFPQTAFLRALDGNTFKFHGEDYPLQPLLDGVALLRGRLLALLEQAESPCR